MPTDLFDIDAQAAAYVPVRVKLRGKVHTLGDTAMQLLQLSELSAVFSGEDVGVQTILEQVRPLMKILAPEAPEDLTTAEELALLPALTEVLTRFSAMTFPEGPGGPADS